MNELDNRVIQFVPVIFTEWQVNVIKSWSKYETISEAAEELGISEHTLNTHLKRMRKKLNVTKTFQVYKLLHQQDLI